MLPDPIGRGGLKCLGQHRRVRLTEATPEISLRRPFIIGFDSRRRLETGMGSVAAGFRLAAKGLLLNPIVSAGRPILPRE
jgi:hypothetical protein